MVEVRELHIKAVVGTDPPHRPPARTPGTDMRAEDREMIVAQCVEQVLEILKKERER